MSDLIRREDAIRWVKTECNPYGKPTLDFESGKKVIEHLEHMPFADRPQGEWEERPSEDWISIRRWYCSECGEWQTYGMTNYCPNCGADMRGDNDGKDIQSADE